MGITSRIDRVRKVILTVGAGILTRPDWLEYTEWVWSDPELSTYDKLVDLRNVTRIDMSAEETRMVVARIPKATSVAGKYKVAIVAESDVTYGMSRMYEMLRAASAGEVRPFRDLAAAKEWLGISDESSSDFADITL